MKYLRKYNESIDEKLSFDELFNFSKKIDGFKGDEFGFEVPYEFGTMTINKVSDYESDVTWWSGGDSQDTDVYDNKVILNMLRKTDSVVRNQNTPIEKVEVYCQAYDAGDGYVGSKWFMTEKEAWDDVEKGEPLVIRVETYVGSNVYIAAKNKTRAR